MKIDTDISKINTTSLAYIGDAIYEIYIREHVLVEAPDNVDVLHRKAVCFVRADAQALAIKKMMKEKESEKAPEGAFILTDSEAALVKRTRNRKSASKPKNVDPIIYKWATAFEALVGFLHLAGESERLAACICRAIQIIETDII